MNDKEKEVLDAIKKVKFGTVLVIIQDAEIVQIESTLKTRFDKKEIRQQTTGA